MQRFLGSWLSAGALMGALCAPAMAGGTLFRCGSSYQDRPCDASQPSKVISGNGRVRQQAPQAEAAVVDVECAGRGARAKQIVWAKESGKTAEVQMASATSDEERRMIADVYRRRGSSLDVKTGIEADCMAEKDRAAQGAAMIEAGLKMQGRDKVASAPAVPSELAQPAPTPQVATVPSPAAAADRAARCQSLKAQMDSITSRQQAGGSMDQMEQLNRQRQTAAKAMRDVGC